MTPPSPSPFVLCFLEGSHCVHYVQLILKDWGVKFHHLIESNVSAAKSLQSCLTLCDPRLPRPWDSPGKNTGVGCHFLLQCMKVKSESEVTQSCLTLSDPVDCSLPGSSAHGIFQARGLEWVAIAFSILSYLEFFCVGHLSLFHYFIYSLILIWAH